MRETNLDILKKMKPVEMYLDILHNLESLRFICHKEILIGEFSPGVYSVFGKKISEIEKIVFENIDFFRKDSHDEDIPKNVLSIFGMVGQLFEDVGEVSNSETSCWYKGMSNKLGLVDYVLKLDNKKYLKISDEIKLREEEIKKIESVFLINTIGIDDSWDN
jgi:hypothetical protein